MSSNLNKIFEDLLRQTVRLGPPGPIPRLTSPTIFSHESEVDSHVHWEDGVAFLHPHASCPVCHGNQTNYNDTPRGQLNRDAIVRWLVDHSVRSKYDSVQQLVDKFCEMFVVSEK